MSEQNTSTDSLIVQLDALGWYGIAIASVPRWDGGGWEASAQTRAGAIPGLSGGDHRTVGIYLGGAVENIPVVRARGTTPRAALAAVLDIVTAHPSAVTS